MASHISFVISGLLFVVMTITIRSAPIEKVKEIVELSSIDPKPIISQPRLQSVDSVKSSSVSISTAASMTTNGSPSSSPTSTAATEENDHKQKRQIDNYDDDDDDDDESNENTDDNAQQAFNSKFDDAIDNTLHAKVKETVATIHNNADHSVDTDDSNVFSDVKMDPNELSNFLRRRRDVKSSDQSSQRRKRALSSYDLYNTNAFYDRLADLIEQNPYVRPIRSFAPLYWYPSVYERNVRSANMPHNYESSAWPPEHSDSISNDDGDDDNDDDENPVAAVYDDNDEDNDYEPNRYPILLESSKNPFDNLQLQQAYNTDDLLFDNNEEEDPLNNDDEDVEQYRFLYQKERPYYTRYGPFESYF